MNETAAKNWLRKSWHHLSSAQLLFNANHYTDTIAIEIHYSVEITLKSFLAYQDKRIIKSHDLVEIHSYILDFISFDEDEMSHLDRISTYHIKEAYPMLDRALPKREDIQKNLEFATKLLGKVAKLLSIQENEIKERAN